MSPDLEAAIELLAEEAVRAGERTPDGAIKVDAFEIRPRLEDLLETPISLYFLKAIAGKVRARAQDLDGKDDPPELPQDFFEDPIVTQAGDDVVEVVRRERRK